MPHKTKATPEEKILLVERCLRGKLDQSQASKIAQVSESSFRKWIKKYESEGSSAFLTQRGNRVYSEELKRQAVIDYLSGRGSLMEICKKYKIRTPKTLRGWLKVYNSGKDFRHKMSGGSRMKTGRKVSRRNGSRL